MSRKKAVICTILFAILIVGVATALIFVKPHNSEISFFHAFSPFIVGYWLSERIGKFYDWLTK